MKLYLVLFLLLTVATFKVSAGSTVHGADNLEPNSLDVADPVVRAEFLKRFSAIPRVMHCAAWAEYSAELMVERNIGVGEAYHLNVMAESYEATKSFGKNRVKWHVYVDTQRMVRDLHRKGRSGFIYTDIDQWWKHEYLGCFAPHPGINWAD